MPSLKANKNVNTQFHQKKIAQETLSNKGHLDIHFHLGNSNENSLKKI